MKTWRITGTHDGEEFTADLIVDADASVSETTHPLHELLGMSWDDARSYCIAQGWHGSRFPTHIEGHSALRRRGWTAKQIELLGEPDDIRPNPHHALASPMKCYRVELVEAIESSYGIGA